MCSVIPPECALTDLPHADDPVLCYVDEPWAYFTPAALTDQWGDDWNDTPYEHNAEEPYTGLDVGGVRGGYIPAKQRPHSKLRLALGIPEASI